MNCELSLALLIYYSLYNATVRTCKGRLTRQRTVTNTRTERKRLKGESRQWERHDISTPGISLTVGWLNTRRPVARWWSRQYGALGGYNTFYGKHCERMQISGAAFMSIWGMRDVRWCRDNAHSVMSPAIRASLVVSVGGLLHRVFENWLERKIRY